MKCPWCGKQADLSYGLLIKCDRKENRQCWAWYIENDLKYLPGRDPLADYADKIVYLPRQTFEEMKAGCLRYYRELGYSEEQVNEVFKLVTAGIFRMVPIYEGGNGNQAA